MKILADENIANVAELFGPYGEVSLAPGRAIKRAQLSDVDMLLLRSVTQVDRQLLNDTPVRFVGSATIGTDHVDRAYLASQNIQFAHAPGCNARAVVEYVIAVLCGSVAQWRDKTVAIIGCGNVGGELLRCLEKLGVNCKVYDPFLDENQCRSLVEFEEAMAADIVCVHTPLTTGGEFPTHHMIDQTVLDAMQADAVLINAGRGGVIDNKALLQRLNDNNGLRVVLDVWEHEPHVDQALLDKLLLGTPHIAGYSVEGKLRGTQMLFEAFCQWCGEARAELFETAQTVPLLLNAEDSLESVVSKIYQPSADSLAMKAALAQQGAEAGAIFDALRRDYPLRREFGHFEIVGVEDAKLRRDLKALGFSFASSG